MVDELAFDNDDFDVLTGPVMVLTPVWEIPTNTRDSR